MGYRLGAYVQDNAPDGLTGHEYAALLVLANAAWDTGPRARQVPGIEGNQKMIRRLRLSRTRRFEVLRSLVTKGALEHVERGRHGTGATYAIPVYGGLKDPGNPDASAVPKDPGNPDASAVALESDITAPAAHESVPEDIEGSGISARSIRDFGSKGPGNPDALETSTRQRTDQEREDGQRSRAAASLRSSNGRRARDREQFASLYKDYGGHDDPEQAYANARRRGKLWPGLYLASLAEHGELAGYAVDYGLDFDPPEPEEP